ncbi:Uncharacterised protein [Avibacterium paragallinarum]|uniref:Uncharacterized protein n=1 Tax=Avibacterium paragallinarum TaxID=728 RepID=A0A380X798_AVIPA|nr:Uncharacterised protein [Avibacterium paragallinarum]
MEQQTNHETNKSAVEFSQKSHRTSRKAQKDPNAPFVREKLTLPNGHQKLLLHSCCAPCSGK